MPLKDMDEFIDLNFDARNQANFSTEISGMSSADNRSERYQSEYDAHNSSALDVSRNTFGGHDYLSDEEDDEQHTLNQGKKTSKSKRRRTNPTKK